MFLGEIRDGAVIGMHNWIQMYLEEVKGLFDFMRMYPRRSGSAILPSDHLLTLQFKWLGHVKKVSTSLIGLILEVEYMLVEDSLNLINRCIS